MLLSDRTVPQFMHYAQKTKFSWHKSLNCPECGQLSLVYCSVHKTCVKRFLLHYSAAISSLYIPAERKQKHIKYDISSVISVPDCRTRPKLNLISVSQLYPKLRILDKIGRFHYTLVQIFFGLLYAYPRAYAKDLYALSMRR